MNDVELLEKLKKQTEENFYWHTNSKKEERERWVVCEFLSAIQVAFSQSEVHSLEQDSKIDVRFETLNFQIKEIIDPGFRRDKLYKDAWKSASKAKSLSEVSLVGELRDAPQLARMHQLIETEASVLASSDKYIDVKGDIDLLFYVTRTRASLIEHSELREDAFSELGWRSVSCVNSKQAVVLFASSSAPGSLLNNSGTIYDISG
jgi:hypothetical protein